MAVLGLRFCARASSRCGKRGPFFIAVRGPLTVAASLVAEHKLQTRRLSSRGPRAQLLRGMWDLPGPGLKPVSPALAGRFPTAAPPGKPQQIFLIDLFRSPVAGDFYFIYFIIFFYEPKLYFTTFSVFLVLPSKGKSLFLKIAVSTF